MQDNHFREQFGELMESDMNPVMGQGLGQSNEYVAGRDSQGTNPSRGKLSSAKFDITPVKKTSPF